MNRGDFAIDWTVISACILESCTALLILSSKNDVL